MSDVDRHCDEFIHDHAYPVCLRVWLLRQRLPAIDGAVLEEAGFNPSLFATWGSRRVRVVMASRFGDVGITSNLKARHGYEKRVPVGALSDFSEQP